MVGFSVTTLNPLGKLNEPNAAKPPSPLEAAAPVPANVYRYDRDVGCVVGRALGTALGLNDGGPEKRGLGFEDAVGIAVGIGVGE